MSSPAARNFPAALRASAKRVAYEAGTTIFRTGSAAHSVFFVESGAVRLIRYGRGGEEVVLHDARAGQFFAEASLDSARYHCDAVASTPTELLQVPASALSDLLDADRAFARQWVALLAGQLRAASCARSGHAWSDSRSRVLSSAFATCSHRKVAVLGAR